MNTEKLKHYRLQPSEFELIQKLLGRDPVGVEWALFSALWSEHCSYKSSKIHLKKLFRESPRVVQSFGENAGVVDLGGGERVAFKMESHNHPSFIEPYQGAATGVGGILRDIFTMGARPLLLANYLCFGDPKAPRMSELVNGVVRGIGGYGNCVGVATVTGQTEFHSSYNQNILVNAFALGFFGKNDKIFLSQAKGVGNAVVYVGAKTGRDGIHGASMASESFDEGSEKKRPTIQIGDPFLEKLLIESCLEVMKQDLVVAIQDMGAAGLTSSSFEMASKGGVGFNLNLDQVPLRDSSLTPEDILLSESQERMLLICEPAKLAQLKAVFERWNLDATQIGEVVPGKKVTLFWKGEKLTEIDPQLLTDHAPEHNRPFEPWQNRWKTQVLREERTHLEKDLLEILASPQGTSREWIYEQYDQRVGTQTMRDCTSSVAVSRLPETGRLLGVVLGCRTSVMRFDARLGGADSVLYPSLELAAKGFEALAVTDCLNFGNPENKTIMSEFVGALDGMNQACEKLVAPIISGNVSFYNETKGENITSTPSTGLIGLRDFTSKLPSDSFTGAGDKVYLLSSKGLITAGEFSELRKSQIPFQTAEGGFDVAKSTEFIKNVRNIILQSPIISSRVVGKYGIAYALARMSLAGVSCEVSATELLARPFFEPFYEVIVSVSAQDAAAFEKKASELMPAGGVTLVGSTQENILKWGQIEIKAEALRSAYEHGWKAQFKSLA